MISKRTTELIRLAAIFAVFASPAFPCAALIQASQFPAQPSASTVSVTKSVGTVKTIDGSIIVLISDTGANVTVVVEASTRMVRTAPGQKSLEGATAIQLQDLQVGDRMLVRGAPSADGKSLAASSIIVMTKSDIAAKQERERQDWQKRGTGGLVKAADATSGTITLSTSAVGVNKTIAVHIAKDTVIRRYAPDSVKFDDARPSTLDQIKPGDQLRARGDRSADGSELAAQEIVSGTFQNIAGTVISLSPGDSTVKVMDLITKKPVTLKITTDSQMHKLPPEAAQRIAARVKGGGAGGNASGAGQTSGSPPPAAVGSAGSAKAGESATGNGGGLRSGGGDFQQMLNHMPAVVLADLQKGDAVMIVATEGSANSQPTAISLLTGVEPILSAAPNGGQAAMLLSPWNLGGGGGDAAGPNP
jgi:hypothetical protein